MRAADYCLVEPVGTIARYVEKGRRIPEHLAVALPGLAGSREGRLHRRRAIQPHRLERNLLPVRRPDEAEPVAREQRSGRPEGERAAGAESPPRGSGQQDRCQRAVYDEGGIALFTGCVRQVVMNTVAIERQRREAE